MVRGARSPGIFSCADAWVHAVNCVECFQPITKGSRFQGCGPCGWRMHHDCWVAVLTDGRLACRTIMEGLVHPSTLRLLPDRHGMSDPGRHGQLLGFAPSSGVGGGR